MWCIFDGLQSLSLSIHTPTQDEFGEVPLHAASHKGHVNVMTFLIQRGAEIDYLNKVHTLSMWSCSMLWTSVNKCSLLSH